MFLILIHNLYFLLLNHIVFVFRYFILLILNIILSHHSFFINNYLLCYNNFFILNQILNYIIIHTKNHFIIIF